MKTEIQKTIVKFVPVLVVFFLFLEQVKAQKPYKDQFAHTYSIVARDEVTGEMAVAVQSHWFSVGTVVSWGQSGVGVVATQSFVNPAYGPNGLQLMSEGKSAEEALMSLIDKDEGRAVRQVAFLAKNGKPGAFTGENCISFAQHIVGDNYSVQANMMLNDKVVPAMAKAFEKNRDLPLEDRVMQALWAAERAGGDIRGRQSAALLVVHADPRENPWEDKKINLRVDDSPEPLKELQRLLTVHKAYAHMNQGDLAMEHGDMKRALREYSAAEELLPENVEMSYWKAVTMANNKQVQESLPLFKKVFAKDANWKELTKRIKNNGLLLVSAEELHSILDQ